MAVIFSNRLGNASTADLHPLEQDRLAAIRKLGVAEDQWSKNTAIQRMLKIPLSYKRPILYTGNFASGTPREINEGNTPVGGADVIHSAWVPHGWTIWFARQFKDGNLGWHTIAFKGPYFVQENEIFGSRNKDMMRLEQVVMAVDNRDAAVRAIQDEAAELSEIARQNELKAAAAKKLSAQARVIDSTNVDQILDQSAIDRANREAATSEVKALADQRTQAQLMMQGQALSNQIQSAQTVAKVKKFLPIIAVGGGAVVLALVLIRSR